MQTHSASLEPAWEKQLRVVTPSYILSIGEVGTQGSLSLLDSQPGLMVNPRSMKNCLKTEGRYYVRNGSFWESCPLTSAHTRQNRYSHTHMYNYMQHTQRNVQALSQRGFKVNKEYLRKETWSHNCMAKLPRESLWCGEEIDILWLLLALRKKAKGKISSAGNQQRESGNFQLRKTKIQLVLLDPSAYGFQKNKVLKIISLLRFKTLTRKQILIGVTAPNGVNFIQYLAEDNWMFLTGNMNEYIKVYPTTKYS